MLTWIGIIINFLFSILVTPFIVMDLWKWFVVPLGVVEISNRWHAFGIVLLVNLLTLKNTGPVFSAAEKTLGDKKYDKIVLITTIVICFAELAIWLIGWLISK